MHSFRCSQCLDDGQRLVNVWDVEPKMLVRFSNLDVDFPVEFSSNLTEHLNKLITVFRITRKLQELRLDINYRKVYRKGPEFRAADLKFLFFLPPHSSRD